jgi:hypothetical protein
VFCSILSGIACGLASTVVDWQRELRNKNIRYPPITQKSSAIVLPFGLIYYFYMTKMAFKFKEQTYS